MEQLTDTIRQTYGHHIRVRVCGICIAEERVLMIRHRGLTEKGYFWSPPGGGLLYGEDARRALIREFAEETGLQIAVGNFLFVHEFLHHPLHALELFFRVEKTGGVLRLGTDPETGQHQVLEDLRFMDDAALRQEKGVQLHNIFNHCSSINELIALQGYFKFDKNNRY